MSSNWGDSLEIPAYPASKVADSFLSELRDSLGSRGCVILLVGAASLLLWALPPHFLREGALAWLVCVGPVATLAVLVMAVSHFGLLRGVAAENHAAAGHDVSGAADDGREPVECQSCGALNPDDSSNSGECGLGLGARGTETSQSSGSC